MPSKRSGLRKSPRNASNPLQTPPRKSASPKSPASGLGSKRKRKKSPRKSPGRKKVSKRLYPRDDVDPDNQEDDAPATGGSGDDDLQDPIPGSAPEDVPSLVEELEASDNPLMQRLGQELRDRDSREDALRNELAAVKRDADQRQAIRDYEDSAPTKFHFPPDAIKQAIELFVIPSLRDDTIRRFILISRCLRALRLQSLVRFHWSSLPSQLATRSTVTGCATRACQPNLALFRRARLRCIRKNSWRRRR